MAELTGVEMGWPSGMSSNSCLGPARMSRGGSREAEAEEASRDCRAPASASASGPLSVVTISFSLGRAGSFTADAWAAMSDSPSAAARVDACAPRSDGAWTDWVGCGWEWDRTGSGICWCCDSAVDSIPVDSCGASAVSSREAAVESMFHSMVRWAKQLRSSRE